MASPKISILMSAYNSEETLAESIESIQKQTFSEWELLLVDDGSTDKTFEIMQRYSEDTRIRILRSEYNRGLPAALNWAAKEAQGIYLARQDADDISDCQRLEKQIAVLEERPELSVLGTMGYNIDQEGNFLNPISVSELSIQAIIRNKASLFPHGSVIMRTQAFWDVGGYNELFRFSQDLELFTRFHFSHHLMAVLDKKLYMLRQGVVHCTGMKDKWQRAYTKFIIDKYYNNNSIQQQLLSINKEIKTQSQQIQENTCNSQSVESAYWIQCAFQAAEGKRLSTTVKSLTKSKSFSLKSWCIAAYLLCFRRQKKTLNSKDGVIVFTP